MNRWATACALLAAVGIALGLRCPRLNSRPMHNDEGVNAVKFGQLWAHGSYKYDPSEYHGPTLPYATALINRLTGGPAYPEFSEARLRIVPVLFGTGLIFLFWLLRDALGGRAVIWAGIFTAVSPAMVYYSRDYIHETLLVFFTALALAAGWRYWRSRKVGWAIVCGAAIGLMYATKETFVLSFVAGGIALALNQFWNRKLDASGQPVRAPKLTVWHLLAGAAAFVVVWALLFSSFFTNPRGLLDSFATYGPWMGRAQTNATPHVYPWWFYFQRLLLFHTAKGPVWSEALIFVLALIGAAAGFRRKELGGGNASFVRFVAFFTLALAAFYSLLPYKTPWCLLNFWLGFILLAGAGAAALVSMTKFRWARVALVIGLAAGAVQLGAQACQAGRVYAASPQNPYVYAQTSPNLLELVNKIEALAKASPDGHNTVIKVIASDGDYWPLPWYLRKFDHVGWYDKIPEDPYAQIMIVSAKFRANFDENQTHAMTGLFELRPGVFLELYVEAGLWKRYISEPKVIGM